MGALDSIAQKRLDAVTPWIGAYITTASTMCTLAMAADAFNGFRQRKHWLPCKCFSLNAISLTLLAVAMKLPMDLSNPMLDENFGFKAKSYSLLFMLTAMANFMPSLGSMSDKEVLANVVALGILVVTIVGNVWIQLIRLKSLMHPADIFVLLLPTIFMLILLAATICLAVAVPAIKRNLEAKYHEKHRAALREEDMVHEFKIADIKKRGEIIMKYWVMAESSNPQFVMARSVISATSGLIFFAALSTLNHAYSHLSRDTPGASEGPDAYGGFTFYIQAIQNIGVLVAMIVLGGRSSIQTYSLSSIKIFKIETYWIHALVEWRDSSLSAPAPQGKWGKCLCGAKWLAFTLCIRIQVLTVIVSKSIVFINALLSLPFILLFACIRKISKKLITSSSNNTGNDHQSGADDEANLDNLSRYILLLEGEKKLPRLILKGICRRADNMIRTGRKKQPNNLLSLLQKSVDFFPGVGLFDSSIRIPSLYSKEPQNCWTLPMVTLAGIAVSLPNIAKHKVMQLLISMGEGLSLVQIVDKTLNTNEQLVNIIKAAEVSWVGFVGYMKWLDMDLRETSSGCRGNSMKVLQQLCGKAERTITKFMTEVGDSNPLYWPPEIVAAYSMYRISGTILLYSVEENEQTDAEQLFERLSVMLADILAACLTNLPRVIITMCHCNATEKREKNVQEAFLLLGETEEILKLLQRRVWPPSLDHDKAAYIDEWRAMLQHDEEDLAASPSTSNNETVTTSGPSSDHEHELAITIDC